MGKIKAVKPYIYKNRLNFKNMPYKAWEALGGGTTKCVYPRFLHKLMFSFDVPSLWSFRWFQNVSKCFNNEARLVFVQPVSLYFDTFFTAPFHEMIPFVWDCWPMFYDKMEKWMKRHKVRTAIFTSRQEMEEMKARCPNINMLWCPEAVDTIRYKEGKRLNDRSIDILEFGRGSGFCLDERFETRGERRINHVRTLVDGKFLYNEEDLFEVMGDAKVTICLPRCMTDTAVAGGVETLTQRYWEAMLSRMVIVGHAPQELIDVIGYNPVIEVDEFRRETKDERRENLGERRKTRDESGGTRVEGREMKERVLDVLEHIDDYQELVDKNRKVALEKGSWNVRMMIIREFLNNNGYSC